MAKSMADGWETARRLDRPPILEVRRENAASQCFPESKGFFSLFDLKETDSLETS